MSEQVEKISLVAALYEQRLNPSSDGTFASSAHPTTTSLDESRLAQRFMAFTFLTRLAIANMAKKRSNSVGVFENSCKFSIS